VPATIVVIEDEPTIGEAVAARLRSDGHTVHVANDGVAGVALCAAHSPDLVVLDLMLPGVDGWEVCRRIQADRAVAVIMLTARDEEADLIAGLRVGADDYMTKPFSPRELSARVAALLRRTSQVASTTPQRVSVLGGLVELDVEGRRVRRDGADVHLTATEFDLLARLVTRPGAVFTREQLLVDVWGWQGATGTTRTVDSHIAALRRKLGDSVVRTVHGVGYAAGDR
jgi:DNA-binding response OmpR family regulator